MSPKTPVRISREADTEGVIQGRRFANVLILGPAVLIPIGTTFNDCGFRYPDAIDDILWELAADRTVAVGGIYLSECVFDYCDFEGVGFALKADGLTEFRERAAGIEDS